MRDTEQLRLTLEDNNTSLSNIPNNRGRKEIISIIERANEIAVEPDPIGLIEKMLDLMIEITLAESANFFRLDPETDELVLTSVRGDFGGENIIGLRLNSQQVLPGISINRKQPVIVGDLPSTPYWLRTVDPGNASGNLNSINLSIATGKQIIGVVQLFNYKQAELDLLTVLSDRLAVEIDHRIELDATWQTNRRLWTLVDVIGEVAGTLDRNRLLRLVTENASRLVDAERSSVFLVDPATNEMVFQVAYSPSEREVPQGLSKNLDNSFPFNQSNRSVRNQIGISQETNSQQSGRFGFFNRSAITVPLRSEPLSEGSDANQEHVLGGLMALAKHNASFQQEDAHLMQVLANQTSTFLQVAEMYESAGELFLGVIRALAAAIDAKDPYTQGHSHRVSDYCVLISRELGVEESLVNDIRIGSLLHDIGKIGISDSILLKAGRVTPEEYAVIQGHPQKGVEILSQVKLLEPMLPAIAEHHERLDGSGYPANLAGKDISLMGRIVAVADVFDAMTSHRPYRPALSVPEVLSYLRENSGTLFDPACVRALEKILSKSNYTDNE
jgi:putative nucleotidyltransferase with HDIG domain